MAVQVIHSTLPIVLHLQGAESELVPSPVFFYTEKPEPMTKTKEGKKSQVLNAPVHNDTEQNEV